ncbi:hypothetical protein Pcinc_030734 [Petrolisthes cinctipes]|uniref:Uncharacterized protein n=1 Tax=Petrolisthes cinctipes TaxID=88211 RepID=A0AAE1EXR7_PETCI|nr:hypothetical protein Pcinc_030734 [Petrolisthes cinctipes]
MSQTYSGRTVSDLMQLYHLLSIPHNRTLKQRVRLTDIILDRCPDRVPVMYTRFPAGEDEEVTQRKILVVATEVLRKVLMSMNDRRDYDDIQEGRAFYFIAGHIPSENTSLRTLYRRYKEMDGILYLVVCCGMNFVLQPRFRHGYLEPEESLEENNNGGPER